MDPDVIPVFVSFRSFRWIKIGLGSYRKYFPRGPVLIVDNNYDFGHCEWDASSDEERAWLKQYPGNIVIKNESQDRSHGAGIDLAVAWAKERSIPYLLHLEPDCLISGRKWYYELRKALEGDVAMAGNHQKTYGPIHVTPSLWKLGAIQSTFRVIPRGEDWEHPKFLEVFNIEELARTIREDKIKWSRWHCDWDTGQKAWFEAAVRGKAVLVKRTYDFRHFFRGSTEAVRFSYWQKKVRFREFLDPDDPPNVFLRILASGSRPLGRLLANCFRLGRVIKRKLGILRFR